MVILIIGILAVIAVPAFLSQRAKAHDGRAKAHARQAQTAIETHWQANHTYAGTTAAILRTLEPSLANVTGGPTLANPTGSTLSTTAYRLQVTSRTNNVFTITRASPGTVNRTCIRTPNIRGGCPTSLRW